MGALHRRCPRRCSRPTARPATGARATGCSRRLADRLDPELAGCSWSGRRRRVGHAAVGPRRARRARRATTGAARPYAASSRCCSRWTNLAGTVLTEAGDERRRARLLGPQASLSAIRAEADSYAPIGAIDELLLEEMARPGGEPAEALRHRAAALVPTPTTSPELSRSGRPPRRAPGPPRRGGAAARVGRADRGRPHDGRAGRAVRRRRAPGLGRLLLGFEIVEMAFGPADPPPDQTIRLAHFTADEPVAMDPAGRDDPEEKLAGRAARRTSRRSSSGPGGRTTGCGDGSTRPSGWCGCSTRRRGHQLADERPARPPPRAPCRRPSLRDLLPVVAAEIEVDGLRRRGRHGRGPRRFADATRAAARPGAGAGRRVNLDGRRPGRARRACSRSTASASSGSRRRWACPAPRP